MEQKKLSVIVPVYNGERWLKQCFRTLQKQSIFAQLEVVLVDDGSIDTSGQMMDEWAFNKKNVVVIHGENQGVSSARNKGLDVAQGYYIAFLDVDDKLDSDYYETLLNNTDEFSDVICSGYIVEYPESQVVFKASTMHCLDNAEGVEKFLQSKEIDSNVWNKLFRKELVKEIRFHKDLVLGEDYYFVFQSICKAKKIKVLSLAKYHYVMNETSAMHSCFTKKKLDSRLSVSDYVYAEVIQNYPQFTELAECCVIDSKVRLVGDLYCTKAYKEYPETYKQLYKQVREFRLYKKAKYSSKKHLIAFAAMKIHPAIYVFLKYKLKLQYKSV